MLLMEAARTEEEAQHETAEDLPLDKDAAATAILLMEAARTEEEAQHKAVEDAPGQGHWK